MPKDVFELDFDSGGLVKVTEQEKLATCTINQAKGGIELRFQGKPSYSVLGALKDGNWHWHRTGKFWYIKDSPQARVIASRYANVPEGESMDGQLVRAQEEAVSDNFCQRNNI